MAHTIKRSVIPLLFLTEIILFIGLYLYGPHGRPLLHKLKKENDAIMSTIITTENDIEQLHTMIAAWQSNPLYQERIAREKLHMAKAQEQVYYLV